ncbi:Quinohemoprotein alcohol dehydrogenase ADH-IIG [Aliiroseovarius pelagivivens]|uniref:Quinohemoprotein alcohol dehydrogenase ADH-IIG n=1 Tax=Aliiroseovarius pelagivivens TaxID=1639690 RepID=A0A2R8AHI6_9RHOB|nr:cytochrome c-550 PedF [Aliiroseovarius pelagivivens]SPF75490.1 Quinohemoprotein alcohol dehydrogenase ADH-IIG [Aliiroseovarius pelagivivens]
MKLSKKLLVPPFVLAAAAAFAHGDVAPQAVDTAGLPDLGEEWLEENPWRDPASEDWQAAIDIGASGYNQNCARCHGLEVVSGGLAPDLRYLSADWDGDEWYLERFRYGMTQNGITKMPAFGDLLGQEAAWAIRTYVETRPDDGAFDDYQTRLSAIRDLLKDRASEVEGGIDVASLGDEVAALRTELSDINASAETGSDAPVAESAVSRAAIALDGSAASFAKAAELLTIGLSAAH